MVRVRVALPAISLALLASACGGKMNDPPAVVLGGNMVSAIANASGNVVGLMPHPDRCSEAILGNEQGRKMFESVVHALATR